MRVSGGTGTNLAITSRNPCGPAGVAFRQGVICPEAKAFGRNRERLVLPTLRKSSSRAKYHARVLSEVWVKQV